MYINILSAIPSIVLALFVGPWSDLNGRKPVIIIPMLGYLASQVVWIFNAYYKDSSAMFLLFTSVSSLFGGYVCLLVGVFSYLSDVTTIRERTSRLAALDFCFFGGVPAGTFASGYVFKYFGYYGIFGSVAVCQVISALYVTFFIEETRIYQDNDITGIGERTPLAIINFHHVRDVFQTTFRKRQYKFRRVIIILITCMLFNVTVFSDGNIFYLYTRKLFQWTEQEFTKFQTLVICFSAVASLIVMPLLSYILKVHDAMIGILATMSKISSLVVIAFATSGTVLFFGACLGCISSLSGIVIRSMLSKCVQPSELGKIYSLLASFEAAVPLFASPLFTAVYNSTIDTFPGATFLVLASIFIVSLMLFCYVFFILTLTGQDFSVLVSREDELHEALVREENIIHSIGT
ncbi:solute carrier family 46 member 3 isoform X2 [Eurytemora carolleeae]|nr:solute carrier family 46 member 3 isoform X2 [Eurytemora carolleeae]XP_023327445.1 solute carrier family 46 member 3 isoform X2 [Eurytemora carolleeae]|eukprot:XP_023327444.1 solute carrier family 46 member 3-like isoform X2 [Eurytemora affinis]